ncbi:MAG TPA: DUF3298 domain-containing protein [Lysobacter sp.]|nr:DUF3298 domain-containing protein [Lysobacter sp.]
MLRLFALAVLALGLAACKRDKADPAPPPAAPATAAPAPVAPPVELKDVVESTPDYIIGISYPPSAGRYPALAAEMKRFADAARADLLEAVKQRQGAPGTPPYDLSLSFAEIYAAPDLVAYGADGSIYTGGAHGAPLIARFVWLPKENRLLRSADLIAGPQGWQAISDYVREQLSTAISQRVDADALGAAEREEVLRNALRMIEDGTEPSAEDFALFEPMPTADGKLGGLRFVFPPYQVGPYSDGTQTVEVPALVLHPHLAPRYRALFVAP